MTYIPRIFSFFASIRQPKLPSHWRHCMGRGSVNKSSSGTCVFRGRSSDRTSLSLRRLSIQPPLTTAEYRLLCILGAVSRVTQLGTLVRLQHCQTNGYHVGRGLFQRTNMHVKEIWIGDVDSETQVESWRTMEAAAAPNRVQDGEEQWSIFHRLAATRLKSSIQGYYSVTVVKKGRLSEGANRTGVHWMGQRGTTTFANPLTPKNRQARYDCDWWSMVAGQWFTIVCVNTSMVGVSCCVANVFLRVVSWHFPVFNCTVCARMKLFFFLEKVVRLNTFDGICIISCSNDKNQQTVVSYGRQILKS